MKKFCRFILTSILLYTLSFLIYNVIMYPELYSTIAKYHLYNDLLEGNKMAHEYYYNTYVSNGKILFDDININTK